MSSGGICIPTWARLRALFAITAMLVASCTAHAQNSGGGSGGHWKYTISFVGGFDYTDTYQGTTFATGHSDWSGAGGAGTPTGTDMASSYIYQGYNLTAYHSLAYTASGKAHFEAQWVANNPGTSAGPAPVTYTRATSPPNVVTHAFVSCVDAVDGAKATGNEYYTFHAIYEDFTITKNIVHPVTPYSNATAGDWQIATVIDSPTKDVQTIKYTYEWTHETDEKLTIGGDVSAGSEAAIAAKLSTGIEVGQKDIAKRMIDYTFTGHAFCTVEWYVGQVWQDMAGQCSAWGDNGYINDGGWSGVKSGIASGITSRVTVTYPGYTP